MKILVPATSANLGPGFDALGLALGLFNEVSISPASFSSVSITGEGNDSKNLKRNNLFISIFNDIFNDLGLKPANFRFVFTNNIPFSRGLGSSSAVIVSAIAAAYEMAGFKADRQSILNKALFYENHPDNIAPATLGGFVSAVVHNQSVRYLKFEISNEIKAVVVIPDKPISTNKARTLLPPSYTQKECVCNVSHAALLSAAFASGRYDMLKTACVDMMHEARRMQLLPELFDVRKIAYENAALMSSLSGSGSSFLNICYADDAKHLAKVLQDNFPGFKVLELEFDNQGFSILKS